MASVEYVTRMSTPIDAVRDFVKDFDNWAPFLAGYESHEKISDIESIWTVRGDTPLLSRSAKIRVTITEWVDKEQVAFDLEGLTEPFRGRGEFRIGGPELIAESQGKATAGRGKPSLLARLFRMLGARLVRGAAKENLDWSGGSGDTCFSFELLLEPSGLMRAVINSAIEPLLAPAAELLAARIRQAVEGATGEGGNAAER